MQIDWLTVAAQLVNFLILVWLLKRLLYRPVIEAMARREERIAGRLAEAAARESEAEEQAEAYRAKSVAVDEQREQALDEARAAAEREKRRLLDEARAEIDEQREMWRKALAGEREEMRKTLEREIVLSAVAIARRALADLADTALEERVVDTFLRRLEGAPPDERALFAGADAAVRVASSFDLAPATRERVSRALGQHVVDYVRGRELVCGIAIRGRGHKLEWNMADYLESFGDRMDALLAAPATRGAPAAEAARG